jgi:hypothetical protein
MWHASRGCTPEPYSPHRKQPGTCLMSVLRRNTLRRYIRGSAPAGEVKHDPAGTPFQEVKQYLRNVSEITPDAAMGMT